MGFGILWLGWGFGCFLALWCVFMCVGAVCLVAPPGPIGDSLAFSVSSLSGTLASGIGLVRSSLVYKPLCTSIDLVSVVFTVFLAMFYVVSAFALFKGARLVSSIF